MKYMYQLILADLDALACFWDWTAWTIFSMWLLGGDVDKEIQNLALFLIILK